MSYAKKFYRHVNENRCIMRVSEVKGTEIRLPLTPQDKLPLSIQVITFDDKQAFDEAVKDFEETDHDMFDQYMMHFIGRVDTDIKAPMTEQQIKRELAKVEMLNNKIPRI